MPPVTFILGPDGFLARTALANARESLDPDGLNTDDIDGRLASVDEIVTIANTPAFFGGPRTVIVEGFLERLSKARQADDDPASSARPKGQADVGRLFSSLPTTQNIIFFDRAVASIPATVKKLIPSDASVTTHEAPRGGELVTWMTSRATSGGAKLPDQLARKIAESLFPKTWAAKPNNPLYDRPPELERLAHEIEKLTLAAHPGAITADLIDELLINSTEDRMFPLIEAIYAAATQDGAREILAARDRGDDPARITNALYQQGELAAALGHGDDAVQTGQELGLSNPNRMYGVAKSSQRSKRPAKAWVARFVESERAIKSGRLRDPWDPLYMALDATE